MRIDLERDYWTDFYTLRRKILDGKSENIRRDIKECDRLKKLAELQSEYVTYNWIAITGISNN